jgi:3-hydroxyacyl-CoA dehydrogenase
MGVSDVVEEWRLSLKPIEQVAIVGAGLVGCSWAVVFAAGGAQMRVFDARPEAREEALKRIGETLDDMHRAGLCGEPRSILQQVTVCDTLAEAMHGADYVQESVFERVEIKSAVCAEIGQLLIGHTVVGSSSSGIPASSFTETVANRERFLIAHPVNPPHLIPVVELVPAPWTAPEILPWLTGELQRFGQVPVQVRSEVQGFILNRLQGALLNEAWALYEEGYASLADIDATVSHGLGLRWALMGPFETIDLNAPGGIGDYAQRLGPLYHDIARSRSEPRGWSPELIEKAVAERRAALPQDALPERGRWRDRRLMQLVAHLRSAGGGEK